MERFYHIRVHEYGNCDLPVRTNGGATVHLEATDDPMYVNMRVAYCNPTDVYCKKSGREHCIGRDAVFRDRVGPNGTMIPNDIPAIDPKAPERVHLRKIPGAFAKIYRTVHKRAKIPPNGMFMGPNYESRIREWLPRT